MRAMRSRISRYVRRALWRKKLIASTIGGISASETIASFTSSRNMMTTIQVSMMKSEINVIAPAANISWSTSTSLVMRVTRRPTGLWSK